MDSRHDPVYPDAKSPTSFQDGLEFQDFVCSELAKHGIILQNLSSRKYQFNVGENLQGFEIKQDNMCTKTGRLSIEVGERSRNDPCLQWSDSGILRADNSWLYLHGNYAVIFIFAKNWLIRYLKEKKPKIDEKFGTIRTFYLPIPIAEKCAIRVIRAGQ